MLLLWPTFCPNQLLQIWFLIRRNCIDDEQDLGATKSGCRAENTEAEKPSERCKTTFVSRNFLLFPLSSTIPAALNKAATCVTVCLLILHAGVRVGHFCVTGLCLGFKTSPSAETFHMKMSSICCMENTFSYQWFRFKTRFDTEARSNSYHSTP